MYSMKNARTRLWLVPLLGLLALSAHAQEAATEPPWTHQLVGGLNLTQVALKNWSGGGDDALAWTLSLNGKSTYLKDKIDWVSTYKFAFGHTKLGDQAIRKTDDKIDLETTMTYKMGVYVNPYVAATIKSQFAKGYNYADIGKVPVSQFFDPAYLTQTAGVGYQPIAQLKTRLGVGLREILTRDFNGYADDGDTDKIEKTAIDTGVESVTNAEWQLAENILLTSKLEIFGPLTDLGATTIRSDSNLALKVNKYVNVNFDLQLVQDDAANTKTQVKEALSVGLSYSFL